MITMTTNHEGIELNRISLEHAIVTVSIGDLSYAEYTRPLSEKQVNSITNRFDENHFDLPVLSARNGRLWVVDGKQRIEAARRLGYTHVQCRMLTAQTSHKGVRMDEQNDSI